MKLFLKITVAFLLGLLVFYWVLTMDSRDSWNKVKDLPVVATIGHWSEVPYQESFLLKSEIFPSDMNYGEWVKLVESSDFHVTEVNDRCDVNNSAVDYLKSYDTCAWRIVGPSDCRYSYYVAANFNDSKLSEVVGTVGAFICM